MIDPQIEKVFTLREIAAKYPFRKRPNLQRLYAWTTEGCRGVLLEFVTEPGSGKCTSLEAVSRFLERVTAAAVKRHDEKRRRRGTTHAWRRRSMQLADERLKAAGL